MVCAPNFHASTRISSYKDNTHAVNVCFLGDVREKVNRHWLPVLQDLDRIVQCLLVLLCPYRPNLHTEQSIVDIWLR